MKTLIYVSLVEGNSCFGETAFLILNLSGVSMWFHRHKDKCIFTDPLLRSFWGFFFFFMLRSPSVLLQSGLNQHSDVVPHPSKPGLGERREGRITCTCTCLVIERQASLYKTDFPLSAPCMQSHNVYMTWTIMWSVLWPSGWCQMNSPCSAFIRLSDTAPLSTSCTGTLVLFAPLGWPAALTDPRPVSET